MPQDNLSPDKFSVDSIKASANVLFNTLYLKYKGKKYVEKIILAENSIQKLIVLLSETEEGLTHLKTIEEFIKLLIKENKKLTIKNLAFEILHMVMFYLEVKN